MGSVFLLVNLDVLPADSVKNGVMVHARYNEWIRDEMRSYEWALGTEPGNQVSVLRGKYSMVAVWGKIENCVRMSQNTSKEEVLFT